MGMHSYARERESAMVVKKVASMPKYVSSVIGSRSVVTLMPLVTWMKRVMAMMPAMM